ncbi:hypothetical protein OU415_09935 [Saccharopolyspora sp. WRP15-2]|uniref:Uncharacterized protein n=1 Tax=Saccharopolyspora oryzae TaxID=2997343 RepID=A0ABT4UXD3_9PSEU|nr:hypothetical protein [Saccharopolyspora oryzae]MDA3625757.1 hypothetical protein [Saccharopolyspora oryzae]
MLAYGEKRADQLHEAEEGVSVSFYPADSSGDSVAPVSSADLISVGDDGTAYGWAEGDDDDSPKTPVSVTAQGSTALPPETRIPAAVLGDTGVFASDPGQDAAGLVVISKNG